VQQAKSQQAHQTILKDNSQGHLFLLGPVRLQTKTQDFPFKIVMDNDSWFYHFNPETIQQCMEWHHTTLPRKKPETEPLARKVIGTVCWDSEGCIVVDFLEKWETINAACNSQMLSRLCHALHEKYLKKKTVIL
jgi:hypothetical protein